MTVPILPTMFFCRKVVVLLCVVIYISKGLHFPGTFYELFCGEITRWSNFMDRVRLVATSAVNKQDIDAEQSVGSHGRCSGNRIGGADRVGRNRSL